MIKLKIFVLLSLPTFSCFSQQLIRGVLLDAVSKRPIPYANIGIINSPVGTLSNEDGTFQVSIPMKYYSDTLIFSALAYERRFVPVRTLLTESDVTILLNEKVTTLREVVVKAPKKRQKLYELGNKYNKGGFLYADSISAGAAMALLIENKYPSYHAELTTPFSLEEAKIFISKNSVDNFKLRVRFLQRDSISGQPGSDLFAENIIITSSLQKGWLDVDLRSYQLVIDRPFYFVLEWIMSDSDRVQLLNQYAMFRKNNPDKVRPDSAVVHGKKIGFWSYLGFDPGTHLGVSPIPFSLQNYTCYYRTHSFAEWKRAPVILTARVSVSPL